MSKVAKVVGTILGGIAVLGIVGSCSSHDHTPDPKDTVAGKPFTSVPSESAHPEQVRASAKPKPKPTPHIETKLAWVNEATGYTAIRQGSAADHYLTTHWGCEASLRVQFVDGYNEVPENKQPLWKYLCKGVSDSERDSMVQAAVMWGSDHPNG